MLIEIIVCGAAGGLLSRAVFWHVPKLAMMIWEGWREAVFEANGWNRPARPADPLQAAPTIDMDLWEAKVYINCTSSFWLEPTRWERPTWPATPVSSDLRYDGSINDKILAFAMLTGPEQLSLAEQRDLTGICTATPRISSKKTFDRRY